MTDGKKPIYARLKAETLEALKREATKEGRTLSNMIAFICDKWVEKK
jgi:hypothetical protein